MAALEVLKVSFRVFLVLQDEACTGFYSVFSHVHQHQESAEVGWQVGARVVTDQLMTRTACEAPTPPPPRDWHWVMVNSGEQLYYWDRHTGETRWKMKDGWSPHWWLRPDGRHVYLATQRVHETIDDM